MSTNKNATKSENLINEIFNTLEQSNDFFGTLMKSFTKPEKEKIEKEVNDIQESLTPKPKSTTKSDCVYSIKIEDDTIEGADNVALVNSYLQIWTNVLMTTPSWGCEISFETKDMLDVYIWNKEKKEFESYFSTDEYLGEYKEKVNEIIVKPENFAFGLYDLEEYGFSTEDIKKIVKNSGFRFYNDYEPKRSIYFYRCLFTDDELDSMLISDDKKRSSRIDEENEIATTKETAVCEAVECKPEVCEPVECTAENIIDDMVLPADATVADKLYVKLNEGGTVEMAKAIQAVSEAIIHEDYYAIPNEHGKINLIKLRMEDLSHYGYNINDDSTLSLKQIMDEIKRVFGFAKVYCLERASDTCIYHDLFCKLK